MNSLSFSDPLALLVVATAIFLGGILKGATGAGLPIIAIPVVAAVYDVRVAVAVMVVPNFLSNVTQIVTYRSHELEPGFARNFALAGMAGAVVGSLVLAWLPVSILQLCMATIVLLYIALRLLSPDSQLSIPLARKLSFPVGTFGGLLQGAAGVSAPVAVTFLNAIRLARPTFIFTVSVYFAAMCLVQFPVLMALGLMTFDIALLGLLALLPLMIALPIGERIGQRFSPKFFDQLILTALALLAIHLIWAELVG